MSEELAYTESLPCPHCNKRVHPTNWARHMRDNHPTDPTPLHMASGERLPLAAIKIDGGTQSRAEIDEATIAEYAEDMSKGDTFPAVVVYFDGTDYWLADGFHRVHAAQRAHLLDLDAIIHQGTQRDAILHSVGANARHGKRRTNADKKRAVERLLRDDEWVKWSDREIGKRCNVAHATVAKIRAELFPHTGQKSSVERTYTNRSGNQKVMKTGKIADNNRARTAPTRSKTEDDYQDDVPAVDVMADVETKSTTAEPPRTHPEATPRGQWNALAGTTLTSNGKAPIKPPRYQKQFMNGAYHIVDTEGGEVIDMDTNIALLNNRPQVEPDVPPMVVNLGKQANLETQETLKLVQTHKMEATRAALMLILSQDKRPLDIQGTINDLITLVKERVEAETKATKKTTTPKKVMDAMKNAIVDAFGLDPDNITPSKWSEINGAAKQLCTVNAKPEEIAGVYAYCKGRFTDRDGKTNFSTAALAKYYAEWKATPAGKKAGTVLVAVESPTPEQPAIPWEWENRPMSDDPEQRERDMDQMMRDAFSYQKRKTTLQPTGTEG